MKKFAAFLMILSASVFTIGCNGKSPEKTGKTAANGDKTPDGDHAEKTPADGEKTPEKTPPAE